MARVFCEPVITSRHVLEAKRLLKASVLKIEQSDVELEEVGASSSLIEVGRVPFAYGVLLFFLLGGKGVGL
eukprot:scaffold135524_cov17-Tisochrysis_lutea.AAC.1